MTVGFRAALVLMVLGWYGFGDNVSDPTAYTLRLRKLLSDRAWPLDLREDRL